MAEYSTKELLLAAQRAMVPQGHKAMPLKALRKLGALIEAPWNDEAAPDVLRRIRRAWDEMHATRAACVAPVPHLSLCASQDDTMRGYPVCDCGTDYQNATAAGVPGTSKQEG